MPVYMQYYFWLVAVSIFVFLLERLVSWRKEQKVFRSIEELDWIGNFRFHWGEVVVYKTLSYLPLVVLGVDGTVILIIAVIGTLMQDLNHANLPFDYGPLKYILNSPCMHVWHHDVEIHGKGGQNFGIVLSVWDWLFGTVYWPADREQPQKLGFLGMETYPRNVIARLFYPFYRWLPLPAFRGSSAKEK